MAKKELNTVKEILFWSYANLAMAHTAVDRKQEKYVPFNYMIRAKLFKGLIEGSMNIRTIFDDEKIKLLLGNKCSYCGSTENLALDHIFSKKMGGKDAGDNLIYACRSCNSSKGKKDMMEWMGYKKVFPPLMILRRYLKLVVIFCIENDLMECSASDIKNQKYPFNIEYIPVSYPKPNELVLVVK
ncbi:HNH endonuclease [Desulfobacula sp.]|uniref:HNH endonuclease n=1 Tax=Desulfobacula sp. TaxID=2593537 RepID=UPI002714AD1F|nr:HNH endonuclease signature motif containing protein [Desulfobacula sp.]